jgi:alanine dehydrogenase
MTVLATPIADSAATRRLLPMTELIDAVGRAFDAMPDLPHRVVVPASGRDWVVMPGLTREGGMFCKLLGVGHGDGSPDTGKPTISGLAVLLAPDGTLRSVLDGATLTALRTAAIAAHATRLLACPDASVLAVFGVGALAEEVVEALSAVRPLTEVRAVGRSPERADAFQHRLAERGFHVKITTPERALHGADLVVTATTSPTPVFADRDVEAGTHINAMGSYRPERAEIPAATVARARVVVETRESAWLEAGDLIQPRDARLIDEAHVLAELHEHERIAAIRASEPDAVTLFKSVGHVALDLAALDLALAELNALPQAG